jgi:hypothetical protein
MPDLDQTLTELVDAYRPDRAPAFALLQRRERRRRRARGAAVVLGVAAVVTATALLPSALRERDTAQPANGGVIPFTATHPKPTDAPPPEAAYAGRSAPFIRDCDTAALALTITWRRDAGDLIGDATIRFRPYLAPLARSSCWLGRNEPALRLLGSGGAATGPASSFADQPALISNAATPRRVVSDTVPVLVPLRLSGSNCLRSGSASLTGLSGSPLQATFAGDRLPCDRARHEADGQLVVGLPHSADEPSALVPAERQRLQVSLEVPAATFDGSQFQFLARLKNPTGSAISLSPCPAYMLNVGRTDSDGSTASGQVGHLNCEAAPDAVPPHGDVAFEMLARDPAAGQPGAHDATHLRLQWGIAGPPIADATTVIAPSKTAPTPSAATSPAPTAADTPICDPADLATVATGGGVESNGFTGADIEMTNTGEHTCRLPDLISSLAVADTPQTHNLPIEQTKTDHGGPQTLVPGEVAAFGIASVRLHGSGNCPRPAPTAFASPTRLQFQFPGQPPGSADLVSLPDGKRFTIDCWPVVVSRLRKPDGGLNGTALSGSAPSVLWPADGATPVAGACGASVGPYATVETNPDTPMPRCQEITGRQRLRVVNASDRFGQPGRPIFVTFAGYRTRRLAVGQATIFDRPARSYLEPGVHDLHLSLYPGSGGAEIWLKQP